MKNMDRLKLIGTEFSASKDCIPTIRKSALHCPFTRNYSCLSWWQKQIRLFDSSKSSAGNSSFAIELGKYSIKGSNESYKRAIKEKNYILFFLLLVLLVAFSGNTVWERNRFLWKRFHWYCFCFRYTKEMAKFGFCGVWFVLCIIKGLYFIL